MRSRWEPVRMPLVVFFFYINVCSLTFADVNVWETLLEPTVEVEDLICDPDIPNRMYGITMYVVDQGHIYYVPSISENDGQSWQPSFDGIGIDPEPETWFVCRMMSSRADTYELYFVVSDSNDRYARIYRSIDRGVTWQRYADVDVDIYAITISPHNHNIWIAGGRNIDHIGVIIRSADAGKTWSFNEYGGNGELRDIEFSQSDPNIVVACAVDPERHIIRSKDLGQTWTILPTLNWGWNSSQDVIIHPVDPEIMVAAIQGPPRWSHFMCRTTDGGQNWSVFGPDETDFYGYGGSNAVHFDSRDPNIIYVHKIKGDVLWRSTNGGIDWELTLQDVSGNNGCRSHFVESPWDENTVYVNIAGVFASRDRGHTWIPTGQLTSSAFYVHPTDSNYLYSASNNQSFFRSTDRGKTWSSSSTGIPFYSQVASFNERYDDLICASPFNPQTIWMACCRSMYSKDGYLSVLVRSDDYGATWRVLPDIPGEDIIRLSASRHVLDRLFAVINGDGSGCRLVISDDGGETWRENIIPGAKALSCFTETNQDSSIWLLLGQDAIDNHIRFYRSNDEGVTWFSKGNESGLGTWYNYYFEVVTDPHHDARLYITSDNGWVSEDLGDTWAAWLDSPGAGYLYIDPEDPKVKYCSGYRTSDNGKTWTDNREFSRIQFDSSDSNLLYQLDPNQRPVLIKKMTIASEKPDLYMAGFGPTFLNVGCPSLFQIYAYAKDSDPNDQVTSIELFYNGEPIGERLSDESAPGSGLFYKLYDITPSASGTFNLQLRAKDRFGMLSDPWPRIKVK